MPIFRDTLRCFFAVVCLLGLSFESSVSAQETKPKAASKKSAAKHKAKSTPKSILKDKPAAPPQMAEEIMGIPLDESYDTWGGRYSAGCINFCCLPQHGWANGEFLLWFRNGESLPPLATTSPDTTALANVGVLGLSTTSVLVGNQSSKFGASPGGRVDLGYWLDDCETIGFGGRFYGLGGGEVRHSLQSDGGPLSAVIARPFADTFAATNDSRILGFPNEAAGGLNIDIDSDVLGGDAYLRLMLWDTGRSRVDLIGGYQFSRVDGSVTINDHTTIIGATLAADLGVAQNTAFDATDIFDTKNEFHGGQVGLMCEMDRGPWSMRFLGKVGFGNMRQTARINGTSSVTVPMVAPVVTNNGILAQSTNIGEFTQDEFAVIPELGMNFIYHLSPNVDLTLGYSFIYWSSVVNPGDGIDLGINTSQNPGPIVGAPRPAFAFQDSSFWVHGLSFGAQYRF